jgi:type I restriction enzyme S subunit
MSVAEFAEIVGGGTPSTKNTEYFDGDIPWLTPKDLSNYNFRYISRGERNITKKGMENSSARIILKNSILLTTRAPVGYVAIAANGVTTNQGFHSLVPNLSIIDPLFLYYLLKHNTDYLKNYASGTTFGELSGGTLKTLKFSLPPLSDQRAIAKILSDLDEKIELNRQMNKTFESIAKAIFKHWFIDFEFPNEQGKPYKLSGGKMVETELREIPRDWRLESLSELVDNVKLPLKPGKHLYDRKYVPIESIPMNCLGLLEFKSYDQAHSSLIAFEEGDILFGAMRAYFHRVNFAPFKGITRTTTFVLRPKNQLLFAYVLLLLNQDSSVDYANQHSKGTTMPYAVWENGLADMLVVIPSDETIKRFSAFINPFLKKMSVLSEEIISLRKIRDSLLPKLMLGQVKVTNRS